MSLNIEALKGLNLVDFLTDQYGLKFRRAGNAYVCLSPFTQEKDPSFFVRLVEGRWLFKDFSSGNGGTIFDFVRIKENLRSFSEALAYVREQVGNFLSSCCNNADVSTGGDDCARDAGSYDIFRLYKQFREEDVSVCREYLLGRGIAGSLVNELVTGGIVVHNRYQGASYCCFAVYDAAGELHCLDNHQIGAEGNFVLGRKHIFSLDWAQLPEAEKVVVSEGIIDYLSVKTLENARLPGLALLGNQVCFDGHLLNNTRVIVSALDDDAGGHSAVLDLTDRFPDKEIQVYDLEGHKDPNELLQSIGSGKGRKLSPERKLELYREFQQAPNKAQLARRWGIDRSYMYEIVGECEKTILDAFAGRRPGRKSAGKPASLQEAWQRIEELEERYQSADTERELLYCRSEFLKLRLKWAEIEAAELRGEAVEEKTGSQKKTQTKKKKKKRPSG